jgi:MFS family permease
LQRWYAWYRRACIVNAFVALGWTTLMVLPFSPFSYALPIIESGGPGQWLTVGYLLFLTVGVGLFGWLSTAMHIVETGEGRRVNQSLAMPGLALLFLGVDASCIALGLAGALGGYQYSLAQSPTGSVSQLLSPFVYPISGTVLVAVLGSVLTLLALIRARGP